MVCFSGCNSKLAREYSDELQIECIFLKTLSGLEPTKVLYSQYSKCTSKDYVLVFDKDGLYLQLLRPKFFKINVDFFSPGYKFRINKGGGFREPIAKALGLKKDKPYKIFDATAGFGRDAYLLASLGNEVCMSERNPIVYILLKDGLRRAIDNENFEFARDLISRRIKLFKGDSKSFIKSPYFKEIDILYLDPMFSNSSKKSLVKKEMQILNNIVDDSDAHLLLNLALPFLNNNLRRIVVKRPRIGKKLTNYDPDLTYKGKRNRYDIYLHC